MIAIADKELKKNKVNCDYAHLLSIILLSNVWIGFLRFFFYKLFDYARMGSYLFCVVWLCILIFYFINNYERAITFKILCGWVFYFLFLGTMYLLFPNTRLYYKEYFDDLIVIMLVAIPGAVLVSQIADIHKWLLIMGNYLRIATVLWCSTYIIGGIHFFGSMGWGSRMVPLSIFYYLYVRELTRKNVLDIVLFCVALFFSFLGGRQSLIFVSIAIVFGYLFFSQSKTFNQLGIKIFIALLLVLLIIFYENFITSLIWILDLTGISSRSLNALVDGSLLDFSNRENVYKYSLKLIETNGIKISGIFGDRYYLRRIAKTIAYPHNLALEILIDFGTGLGSIILIGTLVGIIAVFIKCKKDLKMFFFAFLVYGVGRYLVSSSIFIEINFIVFMGLLFNKNILKKRAKE